MFEQMKKTLEKIAYWQYVVVFFGLAVLRISFSSDLDPTYEGNWVAMASLGLALLVLLYRFVIASQIEFFLQRLLALASLVAALVLLGSNYYFFFFLMLAGFGLLRRPLTSADQGLGWKFELPLAALLFANTFLGVKWLFIVILALLVVNESFGKRLKKLVTTKLMSW